MSLRVYNARGQLVRTLVEGQSHGVGDYTTPWDGRDNAGNQLSSGIYFYRLITAGFVDTGKMVLMK